MLLSNMLIYALRNAIPKSARLSANILIITAVVSAVQMLMNALLPNVYQMLGVYLAVVAVDLMVYGSAEDAVERSFGKSIVNSLLTEMKPLAPLFLPVNTLGGGQSRETTRRIAELFESDNQVCLFPAGICARKIDGQVTEMPWKKMFINRARTYQRHIIPVHCTGENSRRFYLLAKLGKMLHLKFNIAMLYLVDELYKKQHQTFTVTFGKPIPWQTLDNSKTDQEWAAEIRQTVINLGTQP